MGSKQSKPFDKLVNATDFDEQYKNPVGRASDIVYCSNNTCNLTLKPIIFVRKQDDEPSPNMIEREYYANCYFCKDLLQDLETYYCCNQHDTLKICLLCFGYQAQIQTYSLILDTRNIHIDWNKHNLDLFQSTFDKAINNAQLMLIIAKCLETIIIQSNICQNFPVQICQIILSNLEPIDCIKIIIMSSISSILNNKQFNQYYQYIVNIFDKYFDLNIFITTPLQRKWTGFGYSDELVINWIDKNTKFELQKLCITVHEYNEIKQSKMYRKYIKPNQHKIEWESFIDISWIKQNLVNNADNKLLFYMLSYLNQCHKFNIDIIRYRNYSYEAHEFYPGGPPQISRRGIMCILNIYGIDHHLFAISTSAIYPIGLLIILQKTS